MRYIITGRNIEITKALRNKIEEKLSKLDKFFIEETEVYVTLNVKKLRHIMEVTIPIKGSAVRAEVETDDMYAALDEAVDIIVRQLNKHKKKLKRRHKLDSPFIKEFTVDIDDSDDDDEIKIERTKRFALKPMSPEEACMEMDLLGHNFFVFRNGETEEVNVVYKRKNKDTYGLIEPEF